MGDWVLSMVQEERLVPRSPRATKINVSLALTFMFFHQYFRFNLPACCSNWAALCCNLSVNNEENKQIGSCSYSVVFVDKRTLPARSSRSDKFLSRSKTLSTFCRIISTTSSTWACCWARRFEPPPPPAAAPPGGTPLLLLVLNEER